MKQKRILTVQDLSCLGKCSLSMSAAILSAMGHEAACLPTALLSTHTGEFKGYTFLNLAEENKNILNHWRNLNLSFDGILVGYLGGLEQIENTISLIKRFGKDAFVVGDPAMADGGELYAGFTEEYVEKMKVLCNMANIITPNADETNLLSGSVSCPIVETGVAKNNEIGVRFQGKEWLKPKFPGHFYGTGDAFSAALISAYMKFGDMDKSIEIALNFVWGSIEKTVQCENKRWYGINFEQNLPYLTSIR